MWDIDMVEHGVGVVGVRKYVNIISHFSCRTKKKPKNLLSSFSDVAEEI